MSEAHYTDDMAPSYALVARQIHQMLSHMEVDERLMPERRLSEKLGVSRVTLRRSLDYFQRRGILRTQPGGGTWLARPVEALHTPRKPQTRIIGLLVETVENAMIARIVRGLERCASEKGYHLAIAHDYGDLNHQIAQLKRMKDSGIAGLAFFPDTHHDVDRPEFIKILSELSDNSQLVLIDRYVPGVDAPCVLSDNYLGSYLATEHMILTGHRRLGLLGFGPASRATGRDRRKGFVDALKHYDLGEKPFLEVDLGMHDYEVLAMEAVKSWIAKGNGTLPFDGLVCMQDNMAYGAFLALKEAGISVPDDVALIGYDNLNREMYQAVGLDLSSIDQPAERIGHEVAQRLIARVEGEPDDGKMHVLLKPHLVVRRSCGHGHFAT